LLLKLYTLLRSLSSFPVSLTSATSSTSPSTSAASTSTTTLLSTLLESSLSLCLLLKEPFVHLSEARGLVGKSKSQALESGELNTLSEDDSVVDLVKGSGNLLVGDHLGDESGDLAVGKVEHLGKTAQGESVVVGSVGEKVCP
jgi:hypothetical protein